MKRNLLIFFLCISSIAYSQDIQRFAERGVIGSARYVGMGGAMTAIGGDPTAAMDNPAGLGLYRHSEISISLDETIDFSQQTNYQDIYQRNRFALPQASLIWAWGDKNKQKGLIFSNLMFNINRLNSYNRDIYVRGQRMGIVPTICNLTNGLPENEMHQDDIWYNQDIVWLSILGYDSYLINPISNNQWIPAVDLTDGELSISEIGSTDQYTISWAGNINNQWYIGASLNIPTITYTKHTTLHETNRRDGHATLNSMFHVSGVGVSASLGIISRPVEWLRIGASLHTPTTLSLTAQTEGNIQTRINTTEYNIHTPASGAVSTTYATPLRTSISIAGQWKNIGLLSLQYDYAHALREKESQISPMNDIHTLRAGMEAQVYRSLYINAGYVYESSFTKKDDIVGLAYNSIRTDTDYRYTQSSQYASLGFGYRNNHWVAQVAYQYGWQLINQYASECQANALHVKTQTHRLVCTFAWRL
jgi:hypothetical protein